MKLKHCNVVSLVFGAVALTTFSQVQAAPVSLNNQIMIPGTMTWMQDLSNVTSSTASGVTVMENMDGTTTYMGMDNVSMDGGMTPLWNYNWSLTADPDPFIAGSFTVTNTSAMMQTFDLTFGLPVSPSFTDGYQLGNLSGSFLDADGSGGATLNINDWSGLIDGANFMNLFVFGGSCFGTGCSVDIAEVSQGPTAFSGPVNSTIGIHMNFGLSAGDSVTFNTLYEVTPVPLPAAVWLFGGGLIGLLGFVRRK